MTAKFLVPVLILPLAVSLQFYLQAASGLYFNFVLAALVASAFFVNLLELVILALFAIFILNWQPAFNFDLLALGLLPFAAFYASRLLKWKSWLGCLVAILAATAVFYALTQPFYILRTPAVFLTEMFGVAAFGIAVSAIFRFSAYS